MDMKDVQRVLNYCLEAYDWLNKKSSGRDKQGKFRSMARTYPQLFAQQGLVIPLLNLLKSAGDRKSVAERAYTWVVLKILDDVVINNKKGNCRLFGELNSPEDINVKCVLVWIKDDFLRACEGWFSPNIIDVNYGDLLARHLDIVKKFAESMIPPEEEPSE